jgi:hypothetical protein
MNNINSQYDARRHELTVSKLWPQRIHLIQHMQELGQNSNSQGVTSQYNTQEIYPF